MKWVNHQIVTGVVVYTATQNLLFAAYSMAGAILPDKMEGNPRTAKNYWSWRSKHRGWSHWPLLYLGGMAILLLIEQQQLSALDMWDMSVIAVFMLAGALLHIAEDAVCGKVPFLLPSRKAGMKLFQVGSYREYIFSLILVALIYIGKKMYS